MDNTTICFDFGNTRLKYGVFSNGQLIHQGVLTEPVDEEINAVVEKYQARRTLLSSVIKHNPEIENFLRKNTQFLLVGPGIRVPFNVPIAKPETIGADRLAIAAYAATHYSNQNNLVIALGSCITYNFVNKYHTFLGGSISPGMEMRFKSMHEFTAMLPLVKPNWNYPLIGYDTRTNLLSGVLQGMAAEMNGIIENYEKRFLNFNVLLTGGDAGDFARLIKYKIFADPALILKGLYAISEYNHE